MSMFCDETQLSKSLTPVPDRLYSLNCARSLAATAQVSQAVSLIRSALPVLIEGLGPDAPNTLRAQRLLDELLPGAARQSSTLLDDARIFSQWTIQPVT